MGVRAWTQVSGVKLMIRSQEPEPLSHQGPLFKIWFWSRILYFNHLNFKSNWSLGRLDKFRKYVTFFNMHTFDACTLCSAVYILMLHNLCPGVIEWTCKHDFNLVMCQWDTIYNQIISNYGPLRDKQKLHI